MRLCLALVGLTIAFSEAPAEIYLVTPDATGDFATIQAAIDFVADGDIVELADGTFTGEGNRNIDYLGKAITVRSQSGNAENCVIDIEGAGRGFRFHSDEGPDALLQNVTVRGGYIGPGPGGGVYCSNASPTIEGCIIRDNTVWAPHYYWAWGGGMACESGASPLILDCHFIGNRIEEFSGGGGGLFCFDGGTITVIDCTFEQNWVEMGSGGGLLAHAVDLTLSGCRFLENEAELGAGILTGEAILHANECVFDQNGPNTGQECWGGGVHVFGGEVSLTECVFNANVGGVGAGCVVRWGGSCVATRCTFVGNTGAVVMVEEGQLVLNQCTFVRNHGAIHCGTHPLHLHRCIIAFATVGQAVYGSCASLICCDIFGNAGGDWVGDIANQYGINGNISADPLFCDPDNYDFTLDCSSPCLPGNHPDGSDCGTIGTHGIGCGSTPVEVTSWGRLKLRYRR